MDKELVMKKYYDIICHANLPRAGLGNKLFVWAHAWIFSQKTKIPLIVFGWSRFQLAPIIKGFDFRLYLNYFKNVNKISWLNWLKAKIYFEKIVEPNFDVIVDKKNVVYSFNKVPHWADYFKYIKPYRNEIRQAILDMCTIKRIKELKSCLEPVICVNVRMGDFRCLAIGESFDQVGCVQAPLEYFIKLVYDIRKIHGSNLPVTLVSDGKPDLLKELLNLPFVKMGPKNSKIVDILMMAQSKILITAPGSTFSLWGGFLGDNVMIIHKAHCHHPVRPNWVNEKYYEGPAYGDIDTWPNLLIQNIKAI